MSNKIWIVHRADRYSKKYKIFHSELELIKGISDSDRITILEYDLKSTQSASHFLKSRERDTQLRTVLGELGQHETNALALVELYNSLVADNPQDRYRTKQRTLEDLKKITHDKKSFSAYLVRNKKQFFKVSDSVEWLLAILKCHNFQDHKYDHATWDASTRKYVVKDSASEKLKENFKLAKLELKKKKND